MHQKLTRLLHAMIAIAITLQLAVSLFMRHPKAGRPGDGLYEVHESLGLFLLAVLILYWLWAMVRRGEVAFTELFPWFTPSRFPQLVADSKRHLEYMKNFRLPNMEEPSPLASAIQGLGLTAALLLAVSGSMLYFFGTPLASPEMKMVGWLKAVKEGHEILGSLMWVYLAVHPAVGFFHQWQGDLRVVEMFAFWKQKTGHRV